MKKLSTKAKCPVCGTIAGEPLTRVHGYTIHRCITCQLQFSNPMKHPGSEWYERSPHYRYMAAKSLYVPLWIIQGDWRFTTFMALKLRLKGYVLDIGCGSGFFLRLAKSHGYQVTGIDVSKTNIKLAKEKFGLNDVYDISAEELLSKKSWQRHFDIICLFDVLEHLENPVEVLHGLKKLLKPNGYVVCTVPSYQRWPSLFDPYVELPPHHLTLWTTRALEMCMSAAGIKVLKIIRSPLRTEQLWPHMLWRFRVLLQHEVINTIAKAVAHFVVTPPITKILSLYSKAGGFTLMVVAQN
ncbi:class I SAM-dependent methyltransferase [Candidatus Bathyarchaeota archaeon]|nr:class I SAM-dependent methyltransferase [Candidatus Bathyarchaeota archaeon]